MTTRLRLTRFEHALAGIHREAWIADEEGEGSDHVDAILRLCEAALGNERIVQLERELRDEFYGH